jgi:hypothetical protein
VAGTASKGIWFRETHDHIRAVDLAETNCLGERLEEQGLRRRQAEINAQLQEPFCLDFSSFVRHGLYSMGKDIAWIWVCLNSNARRRQKQCRDDDLSTLAMSTSGDTVASVQHVSIEAEKKFSLSSSCTSPLSLLTCTVGTRQLASSSPDGEYHGLSFWCLRLVLRRCSLVFDVTKLLGSVERKQKFFSVFSLVVKRLFLFLLRVGFGEGISGRYSLRMNTRWKAGQGRFVLYYL